MECQEVHSLSLVRFSAWLRSGIFMHILTDTLLSGDKGVKWAVLQLARAKWTSLELKAGRMPGWAAKPPVMRAADERLIDEDARWLANALQRSTQRVNNFQNIRNTLPPIERDPLPEFKRAEYWNPTYSAVRIPIFSM